MSASVLFLRQKAGSVALLLGDFPPFGQCCFTVSKHASHPRDCNVLSREGESLGSGCWLFMGKLKPAICLRQTGSLAPWDGLSTNLVSLLCGFPHLERFTGNQPCCSAWSRTSLSFPRLRSQFLYCWTEQSVFDKVGRQDYELDF